MAQAEYSDPNEWSRRAWEQNARFWDEHMGEGNDFVEMLEWPASARLLEIQPGERVLDAACGNGLTCRRLAALGAQVTAFDFSEETREYAERVTYHLIDATDAAALRVLGEGQYDAALCSMALFDMAEIRPLVRALARLLRSGGRFVFSGLHPAFNTSNPVMVAEQEETPQGPVTTYSVKVSRYLTPQIFAGRALSGQPVDQPYFHRSLQDLFGACFEAGFVLDGLEETAFPRDLPPPRNHSRGGRTSVKFRRCW